ncbi:hypothetical protein ROJ8625_03337 [Roseivivax jejudonensis]|uniref:Uncharacterized protein n=1 Tax=Roseivivax jejudonensis TaxID=1529041 RepID=A0A1X6ZYE2_9RHOB|nr:hypothetical protein [Roseivivax jejudonensis]SLN65325.1 hypothetical protein ROJ8625_03337 [Roseivivax jejudonensis]
MNAFLSGTALVALGAILTYVALISFDASTAERFGDGSVVLLDHATSYESDHTSP